MGKGPILHLLRVLLALSCHVGAIRAAERCDAPPARAYLEVVRFAAGNWPASPVTLDIDGDADLDIVVSNRFSRHVSVLLNDGAGRFDRRVQVPLPHAARALVPADLEGDGDTDLVLSGDGAVAHLMAVENRGGGLFEAGWSFPLPPGESAPELLVPGDLDGDGDLDILFIGSDAVTLLGDGSGSFERAFSVGTVRRLHGLVAGDMDGDGDLDAAGASEEVMLFLNAGDGSFLASPISPLWPNPSSIVAVDFDSDQDLDLAMVADGAIQVLAGDGNGTFTPVRSIPFRHRSGDLLAFDLDGNGLVDFAAALFDAEALAMYLQTSPGVFSELPILPHRGFPTNLVAGDYDRDGDIDIAATNKDGDDIGLHRSTLFSADLDCNGNGNPDECDIAEGVEEDCNSNGIPDGCEFDCDGDAVPDDCAIRESPEMDCNLNSVPDTCDLDSGYSRDCNRNAAPDECEDCNVNLLPDLCEIRGRWLDDCSGNGVPDSCETDCNKNGVADDCDLRGGASRDGNSNRLPDECEEELRLELGFRAPPWVLAEPGRPRRATAVVRLELTGPRQEWPAIHGWNLRARSVGCRIAEATVRGTAGAAQVHGGSRFFGFHQETITPAGDGESLVSAVMILSFTLPLTLPTGRSAHDLLELTLEGGAPAVGQCGDCKLLFEDDPSSPGGRNELTVSGGAIQLPGEEVWIRFCSGESCDGPVSDLCLRPPFHRGDGNDSGGLDISDALFILAFVFDTGRSPPCTEAADTNNDGELDISDGILILNHLFLGIGAPAPPGPPPAPCDWDSDPFGSERDLGCASYMSC